MELYYYHVSDRVYARVVSYGIDKPFRLDLSRKLYICLLVLYLYCNFRAVWSLYEYLMLERLYFSISYGHTKIIFTSVNVLYVGFRWLTSPSYRLRRHPRTEYLPKNLRPTTKGYSIFVVWTNDTTSPVWESHRKWFQRSRLLAARTNLDIRKILR